MHRLVLCVFFRNTAEGKNICVFCLLLLPAFFIWESNANSPNAFLFFLALFLCRWELWGEHRLFVHSGVTRWWVSWRR